MNVELTIQQMYNEYPTLFIEREDCLNQLFCSIGNGYFWKDGELVASSDSYPKEKTQDYIKNLKSQLVNGKAFQHNRLSLRGQHKYYWDQRTQEQLEKEAERVGLTAEQLKALNEKYLLTLSDDACHNYPRPMRWYCYIGGWCKEYAYLFNYPKNIKSDWLEAIEETKQHLIEDGYDFSKEIDTETNLQEYKRVMQENNRLRIEKLKNN